MAPRTWQMFQIQIVTEYWTLLMVLLDEKDLL